MRKTNIVGFYSDGEYEEIDEKSKHKKNKTLDFANCKGVHGTGLWGGVLCGHSMAETGEWWNTSQMKCRYVINK